MHVRPKGGKYVVEYIFYILYSVRTLGRNFDAVEVDMPFRYFLPCVQVSWSEIMQDTQSKAEYPRSRQC